MDEIDITQYLGETKPGDLCKIRDHPNRELVSINGIPASFFSRDHCSWPLTYAYVCPDCGAEWKTVWHNATNVSLAAIDNCTQQTIIIGGKTDA